MHPHLNTNPSQALRAYAQVEVETVIDQASPHKLILMLFEGAIKSTNQSLLHMQNRNIAEKGQTISRTIRIIEEGLKASLDTMQGGAIALQLQELYDYMLRQLLTASLRNESAPLQEVARLLCELRDAWASIDPAIAQHSAQSRHTEVATSP